LVAGHLGVQELIVIFVALVLVFGGKPWRQIAKELADAMELWRRGDPRIQTLDKRSVDLFTIWAIVCTVLMVALFWVSAELSNH
jgi:hypothetical protein